MPLILSPDDPRLTWQGAVSVQYTNGFAIPWRIPYRDGVLYPLALVERAAMPAGVRLSFSSDTTILAGELVPWPSASDPDPAQEASPLDLYCDGVMAGRVELTRAGEFRFEGLPAGEKLVELWLPQFGVFRMRSLELSDGASVCPFEDGRPRWVTYGSSITHCRAAESPSMTWPAIVAREHGLNLTCLGFGGQCHLDPLMARVMRDLPADYISLKVGINIKGAASLSERTFRSGIVGFVQIVREKHPEVPLVLISPIYSPPHEEEPNVVGFTLAKMRDEVAEAAIALVRNGDCDVHYLDGRELLGPGDESLLAEDGVHPTAEGYKLMGRRFLDKVAGLVFV